jgi:hypothetical protein
LGDVMGMHVEWVDAATALVTRLEPGDLEDAYGTVNARPALVLHLDDAVVIEGTLAELNTLVIRMCELVEG